MAAPIERSSAVSAVQASAATWPGGVIAAGAEAVAGDHRPVAGPAQRDAHRLGALDRDRRGAGLEGAVAGRGQVAVRGRRDRGARCRRPGRRGSSRSAPSRGRRCGRRGRRGCRGWCRRSPAPRRGRCGPASRYDGAVSARCGSEARSGCAAGGAAAHRREGVGGAGEARARRAGRAGARRLLDRRRRRRGRAARTRAAP